MLRVIIVLFFFFELLLFLPLLMGFVLRDYFFRKKKSECSGRVMVFKFKDKYLIWGLISLFRASPVAQMVKNLPAILETQFRSLCQEDTLGEDIATHSSIFAWRIPWTEESGGLQSMGSKRVGHDWERLILSLSSYLKRRGIQHELCQESSVSQTISFLFTVKFSKSTQSP